MSEKAQNEMIGLGLILALITVIIGLMTAVLSVKYVIAISVVLALFLFIVFHKIKPIWVISFAMIVAPFYDILRATYLKGVNFIGAWQEILVFVLFFTFLVNIKQRNFCFPKFGVIDLLVVVYVVWNFAQVFQSPSLGAGLYVWRWYSIGSLFYFLFRFFPLDSKEEWTLFCSAIIGLVAAAFYTLYQYFIMGPEKAAQFVGSLGFTAFYRIGWRLPGPFSSPLVASACFSLLLLFGFILLLNGRRIIWGLILCSTGSLAIFVTLSRSGIAISLFGMFMVAILNFSKIKKKLLISFVGVLLIFILLLQFPKIFPLSQEFVNFAFSPEIDQFDISRFTAFQNIITDAFTKYPLGFGFGGGGAISQTAYSLFGGDFSKVMPSNKLGGDSVFFATLQSSGFLGFLVIIGIYLGFIICSFRQLKLTTNGNQRIIQLFLIAFFMGVTFTLANLTDVWPMKMYVWILGALAVNRYFLHFPGLARQKAVTLSPVSPYYRVSDYHPTNHEQ